MITPDRHREDYEPEADYEGPTLSDEVLGQQTERPRCEGCGRLIFTETDGITYDADGGAWHENCLEAAECFDEAEAAYLRDEEFIDSWVQDELDRMD